MEMFTGYVFVYIFAKALDGDGSSDPSYLGLPVDGSCILFGLTAAHGSTGITQIQSMNRYEKRNNCARRKSLDMNKH